MAYRDQAPLHQEDLSAKARNRGQVWPFTVGQFVVVVFSSVGTNTVLPLQFSMRNEELELGRHYFHVFVRYFHWARLLFRVGPARENLLE